MYRTKRDADLNAGITTIGNSAFDGCNKLTGNLIIPDSVTSLGVSAFYNCSGFNGRLQLSENLTTISSDVFYGCSNIVGELIIPDKVTTIEYYAFYSMSKLTSVVFGEKVSRIGSSSGMAFSGCSGITEIIFTGTTPPTLYNSYELSSTMTNLKTVYVPREAYTVYVNAYTARVPAGAQIIIADGDGDFLVQDGVLLVYLGVGGEVTIPDGVVTIGTGAFLNNATVTNVTFNEDLETISGYAFQHCTALTGVVFNENLKTVGGYAFQGCTAMTEILMNEGLETIGEYAFQNCTALGTLTIPDSVASVGTYAFGGCTGLTNLTLSTASIGDNAFRSCTGLTNLMLKSGVQTIGNYAFYGDNKIAGLILPDTLTSIDYYAFMDCTGMEGNLAIPGSVASIGYYAFYGCTGLNGTLTLNAGITTIEGDAFYGCNKLTGDLIIPDSVTSLGVSAFYNCSGFNGRLQLSENLTTISSNVFYGCSNIVGELIIPDKVTTIEYNAFGSMSKLTSVVFGTGLTRIGSSSSSSYMAFYGCSGITEIMFMGTTVPTLSSDYELSTMTNLKTVYVPREAYTAYVNAYTARVPAGVEFSYETIRMAVRNLQAEKVYSKSVYLSWSPHTNEFIVKYIVERDGVIIGETTDCFYYDTDLSTGQDYTYLVYGLTDENEESGKAAVAATPAVPVINSIKTDNVQNKVGEYQNTVYIETANSKNYLPIGDTPVKGQLYYLDGDTLHLIGQASVRTVTATTVIYAVNWDITGVPDDEYTVIFRLTDADNVTTEKEGTIIVDHAVPERIINVIALGDTNGITISWSISSEVDTTRYRIYRRSEIDSNFYVVAIINNRNTLTYRDTTVAADRLYSYYVVGVNDFGQESPPSEIAVAMKGADEEAPTVTRMTPASGSYINGVTSIIVTATDNVGVARVELYISQDNGETWELHASKTGASYIFDLDTTQFLDGGIRVRAIAYDARGNVSTPLAYIYTLDNTGPEKVTGLYYSSTSVTITLFWNDVGDNDIGFYRVERKNEFGVYTTLMNVSKTLGANILNLTPDTEYIYRVVGYDLLGNQGVPSDDIAASTLPDTTNPVITSIMPKSGYYSDSLSVSITADDDYAIASIAIQTSIDGTTWTTVHTAVFTDVQKKRTATYTIDLSVYPEGAFYVRGVATDTSNNQSDTGTTAPFVQHIIDRAPPNPPTNVQAVERNGVIEVTWQKGTETDLWRYTIYRSTQPGSGFVKLADNLASLNYIDRSAVEGTVYYYRVLVTDLAGNESAMSDTVSAQISADTEPPQIVSCFPEANQVIGPNFRTVSVYVTDNRMLEQIQIEYKNKTELTFSELATIQAVNSYERTVSVVIPLDGFAHGATVVVRVVALDKSGNLSEALEIEYIVDKEAPQVFLPAAFYENDCVFLSWQSDLADDLTGYRIYRAAGSGGYSLIAQRPAVPDLSEYTYFDYSISQNPQQYAYRIEAMDSVGNTASVYTNAVNVPNRSMPIAVINCDAVMEVGVEYEIDASLSTSPVGLIGYNFNFGDGTVSDIRRAVHKYTQIGVYTISLMVTDAEGNQSSVEKVVQVRSRDLLGTARIRVVDDSNRPVPRTSVYFDLGEDNMVVRLTDNSGYATFTAEVGRHAVGCVIPDNEWLPAKKDILVTAGEITEITMTMIHQPMIEGSFEIERMTFSEIIAAGIDISKPENQYIVKIIVTLEFDVIEFAYNPTTKRVIGSGSGGSSGGSGSNAGGSSGGFGYTYRGGPIDPRPLIEYQIIPITPQDPGPDYIPERDLSIAILEIPIGVSVLKEFFSVRLHILNNASSEFSMLDNVVTLNLPDGLAIMDTPVSESNRVVEIPEIAGQTRTTVSWILRGDQVGEYYLSADFIGTLAQFNETIVTQFVANEPIRVIGLEGLKVIMAVENTVDDGWVYFNMGLSNESGEHATILSFDVDGAEPYAAALSSKVAGFMEETFDAIPLDSELLKSGVIQLEPGQTIWKYYKAPLETFAIYIDPNVDWESEIEAIGTMLTKYSYETFGDDDSIDVEIRIIGTFEKIIIDYPAQSALNDAGDKGHHGFVFSDSLFRNPSHKYNHILAKASLGLELASFSSGNINVYSPQNDSLPQLSEGMALAGYQGKDFRSNHTESSQPSFFPENLDNVQMFNAKNRVRNLDILFNQLDFGDVCYYNYGRSLTDGIPDEIAYGIASKKIIVCGKEETLIALAVRGGGYGTEWGSNFNVADPYTLSVDRYHYAFNQCAIDVMASLGTYLDDHGIQRGSAKIWITGFSRAAAVSDLVAARLSDLYGADKIYAYTFATPQGIQNAEEDNHYKNIFCIVNPNDFIPQVAFSGPGWDYGRYGVLKEFPVVYHGFDYLQKFYHIGSVVTALRRDEGIDTGGFFQNFYENPCQKLEQLKLISIVKRLFPTPKRYADSAQAAVAQFVAKVLGGQETGVQLDAWDILRFLGSIEELKLRGASLFIEDPISAPIEVAGTISYGKNGIMNNHLPEIYVAWMTSYSSKELFDNNRNYKVMSFILTALNDLNRASPASGDQPIIAVNADVYVYSKSGELALSIIDGEITEQLIAATVENGLYTVYLPGDEDFEIKIIPKDNATFSYTLTEYENGNTTRVVTQNNILVEGDQTIGAAVVGEPGVDVSQYAISIDGVPTEQGNLEDSNQNELQLVQISCEMEGLGFVFGSGEYYKGQYVNLSAIEFEDDTFLGWYEDDEIISTGLNLLFTAETDRTIVAKFVAPDDDGVSVTGVIRSYNPNNPTTIQLLQNDEAKYTATIPSTSDIGQAEQTFTFEGVAPGNYTLVVTKPGHTSFTVQNVIVGDEDLDLTQDSREAARMMTLLCGDINGDGMINNADLAILWLSANYNKSVSQAANPLCDLNGDGMINNADLAILWLAANYNKGQVVVP